MISDAKHYHSPLQVMMMLHYYCIAEDFPRLDCPAQQRAIRDFLEDDMLQPNTIPGSRATYECTEKGSAFVRALLCVPRPVAVWVVPENS